MRRVMTGVLVFLAACGSGDFTQEELALLRELTLATVPPSPTNEYADNVKAAELGQMFFFDSRFSGPLKVTSDLGAAGEPGKVACVSCHDPANGGTDHRSQPGNTSLGADFTGRNSPSVYNVAYYSWMFWDGRKDSVWSQALGPVESGVEHNFSRLGVAHVIYDHYRARYEEVFGAKWPMPLLSDTVRFPLAGKPGEPAFDNMAAADQDAVNRVFANFGKAIEAYERKLIHRNTAFDKYLEGDEMALSPAAKRGAKVFVGKAACMECHDGGEGGNFADGEFHNTGVSQTGANLPNNDPGRTAGITTVLNDMFNAKGVYSDAPTDVLLAGLAPTAVHEGAFKTPGLRGVSKTAPYMHSGSIKSLKDVMVFYKEGGDPGGFSGTKDEAMKPLLLTDREIDDLVAFMESLDGEPLPDALVNKPALP
ncbi:MAG: cytochrome-c peroxidase [Myxococcota bacterium]